MAEPQKLTPKQEAFCQAIVSGMSQADAYRKAYAAGNMKPQTVQSKASILMADGKVRARVDELRQPMVEAAQLTLQAHLSRLASLSAAAEGEGKYSAAVAAEVARGKASGLYVDRVEHTGNVTLTASRADEAL